jgi:phosphate uptake regulator
MSETRKIQKIGNTLYVSIPKAWTDQLQLKHGKRVTLISKNDSITIYPRAEDTAPREITLRLDSNNSAQSIKRGIIAAYLDGFDAIEVTTETTFTEDQQDVIRETINSLFGLEVIDVTGDKMMIVCLLKQKMPINKTITRIHNVIMAMFNETISALEKNNLDLIKGLTRRSQDIKRLFLVTNRLLRSIILFPQPSQTEELTLIDCVDYLQILHITAEITENLKKIDENVLPLLDQPLPKSIMELLVETSTGVKELYDSSIQALLRKDIPLANNVLDTSFDLVNLWNMCLKENKKTKISSLALTNLRLIIDGLEHIQQHTHEIANVSIDRAEAAEARASAPELTTKAKLVLGKKTENARR